MCVTPAAEAEGVVGGDTSLHFFDGAKAFNTTTTGSGILFRKDIEHEGLELLKGQKHIITANIWATRIEQSKQVLLVTFPDNESNSMDTTDEDVTFDKQTVLAELQSLKVKELKMKLSGHGIDSSRMIEKEDMIQALIMKSKNEEYIKKVANDCTSYAIPVDNLSGMLLTHVEWTNRAAEQAGKDKPSVVTYECQDFDYDMFGVVEKVLNHSYIGEDAIIAAKQCLDYFGPFKYENMLVDLSLESKAEEEIGDAPPNSKKPRTEKTRYKEEEFDMDLIICETEARMRAVANVTAALDEPYVPFKMLFVEGFTEADYEHGDKQINDIPMMAAACLLGDHNNIMFLRKICSKGDVLDTSMEYIHTEANVFINTPTPVLEAELSGVSPGGKVDLFSTKRFEYDPFCDIDWSKLAPDVDQDCIKENYEECGYGFNLKVGLQHSSQDVKSAVIESCLHQADEMGFSCTTIYLPGLDVDESTFDRQAALDESRSLRVKELKLRLTEHGVVDWSMMIEKEEMVQALADAMEKRFMKCKRKGLGNMNEWNGTETEDSSSSLFHRNSKGEVVFTEREAELASDFIASADIEGRVKASLQKKRFVLPQQTHKAHAFFCNESVYGNLNILGVSGLIRMDKDKKSNGSSKKGFEVKFDAWPSKEAKATSDNNKARIERFMAERDDPYWDWPGYQG